MHKNVSHAGFTDAAQVEEEFDSSDWNYGADLDLLKVKLAKFTKRKRGYAQKLISRCLSLNDNSELELSDGEADIETSSLSAKVRFRNPLDIYLILDKVLSYLPVKSLLTCRLVNQTWNAKALPWIQKKTQKSVRVPPEEFPMFCAEFDCADVLPFGPLNIILQGMNRDDCHKFFAKHGSQLRKLASSEYKNANEFDESALQESLRKLQYIFRHIPNLKTLDLNFEYLPKLIPGLFDFDEGESVTLRLVPTLFGPC